jgi:hypothetical protein
MTCAHLNSFPQTAQEDDVMAQRSYDELEHELEAALAELQTNPPQTLEDLAISIVHLQTLAQERTDLVLRDLLQRVERLERRIESLGPSSP